MRLAKKDNDTFPKEIQKSLILPGFKFSSFVLIETIEIEFKIRLGHPVVYTRKCTNQVPKVPEKRTIKEC